SARFRSGGNIDIRLSFKLQFLDRAARVLIYGVEIRSVIVNRFIFVSDVGDVHRLVDVGHVLRNIDNSGTQDRLANVTDVNEIVVSGANVEFDVQMAGEGPAFVNYFCFRGQWRPTSIAATDTPGHPARPPFITGSPDPAVIRQPDPTSIMVSGPPEILV